VRRHRRSWIDPESRQVRCSRARYPHLQRSAAGPEQAVSKGRLSILLVRRPATHGRRAGGRHRATSEHITERAADKAELNLVSALSRSRCSSGDRVRRCDRRSYKCNEMDPPLFDFRAAMRRYPPFCRPPPELLGRHLGFRRRKSGAGGVAPPDSPVHSGFISPGQSPVRTDGGFYRPLTWCKRPGQRGFLDCVELGGIKPPARDRKHC
jgi:hypothetical protein